MKEMKRIELVCEKYFDAAMRVDRKLLIDSNQLFMLVRRPDVSQTRSIQCIL